MTLVGRRGLLAGVVAFAATPRLASAGGGVVLARFATGFATDAEHKARAFNVQLAADAIDRRTIAPGATFSFNDAVGERTEAFGYAKAVVLRDGMIAEGTGGGACQVASTLHGAALLAGLEIALRAPHSRPSAYVRMGLDATVAYPRIDLKVQNAGAHAVTIRAVVAKGSIEVSLEAAGGDRPSVTIASEILEHMPFVRVVERDRSRSDDGGRLVTFGIPGFRVRRTREIATPDGVVRKDQRIDLYPPTDEIVRVAPGWDETRDVAIDPKAARPAAVQLRPSTRVVLDNALTSRER